MVYLFVRRVFVWSLCLFNIVTVVESWLQFCPWHCSSEKSIPFEVCFSLPGLLIKTKISEPWRKLRKRYCHNWTSSESIYFICLSLQRTAGRLIGWFESICLFPLEANVWLPPARYRTVSHKCVASLFSLLRAVFMTWSRSTTIGENECVYCSLVYVLYGQSATQDTICSLHSPISIDEVNHCFTNEGILGGSMCQAWMDLISLGGWITKPSREAC